MARRKKRPPGPVITHYLELADGTYTWQLEDGCVTVSAPLGSGRGSKTTQRGEMEPEELAYLLAAELGGQPKT